MKKKRTKRSAEIMVETDEILFIKGDSKPARSYCPVCRREVSMIAPEQAAQIGGVSTRIIYRWIESGKLHFAELPEGSLLICLDSLRAATSFMGKVARQPGSWGRRP